MAPSRILLSIRLRRRWVSASTNGPATCGASTIVGVTNTTSCAFAGELLVISTSRHGLVDDARAAQPDAGRLFTVRPGVSGPPTLPYRGPLGALSQR